MEGELGRLSRALPLPRGWQPPEAFVDHVDLDGVVIHRAGIQACNEAGIEVTGSAAVREGDPLERAWLELLERAAVIDAGGNKNSPSDRSRPSRSNGVALHRTWKEACGSARRELLERDRVLRAWYGQLALHTAPAPAWLDGLASHEWRCCLVAGSGLTDLDVAVVVGFPRDRELPLARGFAAGSDGGAALEAAASEAVQSLAFLWGLPVPDEPPMESPTPMYHLDYYLYPPHHAALRAWLDGAHHGPHRDGATQTATTEPSLSFDDLTPSCYRPGLFVAKARSSEVMELVFGDPPNGMGDVRAELRVHPIP